MLSRRALLCGAAAALAPSKKIVFVADRASHGYAQHECNAGCLLFARLLKQAVPGVECTVHRDGWPADANAFDGAAAVVLFMNGGAKGVVAKRSVELEPAMKKGAGLVAIHYALDVGKGEAGDRFLDWIGGYYEINWSVNPSWTARFDSIPQHPVTRGVKPFAIFDEWYYHMRFRADMQGVTPLLSAVPPDSTRERPFGPHSGNETVRSRKGMAEHLAWAYQRPEGGRGVGFTGGHAHWMWGEDNCRKLMLNAIAWTARMEIPPGGIATPTPSYEQLLENQDKPMPEGFNAEKAAATIRPR